MQATIPARRSQLSVFLIALALFGTLIMGAAGVPSSINGKSTVDALTGYPSGSVDDQRILAFLKQSGYEGGGTVVR